MRSDGVLVGLAKLMAHKRADAPLCIPRSGPPAYKGTLLTI